MSKQKGFSLIELLVVIVIVGIIASVAIPNLIAARRTANEASAISSLRLIHGAELTYQTSAGGGLFGSFANLNSAGLIDVVLASGKKSGYSFTLTTGTVPSGNQPRFAVAATPVAPTGIGMTGSSDYGTETGGIIYIGDIGAVTSSGGALSGTMQTFDR